MLMQKCSNCNSNPLVELNAFKCPKCKKEICNHCYVQAHNKCPHCGHHPLIRKGGIEDKRNN